MSNVPPSRRDTIQVFKKLNLCLSRKRKRVVTYKSTVELKRVHLATFYYVTRTITEKSIFRVYFRVVRWTNRYAYYGCGLCSKNRRLHGLDLNEQSINIKKRF